MATLSTFKSLLETSDSINEIIECGIEVDWNVVTTYDLLHDDYDDMLSIHDVIQGLYWHCVENHSGQWSDTYKLQCMLREVYTPGSSECGPQEDTCSMDVYTQLNELSAK